MPKQKISSTIIQHPLGQYFINGYLKVNLDVLKADLYKNYDCFIVVSGREGEGKSTLAGQIAHYLDPTYNLDRCVFTGDQFHEAIHKSSKYQAIVFDEAHGALNAKETMTSFNKRLIQTFTEMRYRNLIVLLVLPSFHELGKYPAIHRSNCLIHVNKRGKFLFFGPTSKKKLYINGKKYLEINVRADFLGNNPGFFVYDQNEYDHKKLESTSWKTNLTPLQQRQQDQRDRGMIYLRNELNLTHERIGEIIGISPSKIGEILRKSAKINPLPNKYNNTNTLPMVATQTSKVKEELPHAIQ